VGVKVQDPEKSIEKEEKKKKKAGNVRFRRENERMQGMTKNTLCETR
jgi:hypothetical protein